jgi:hypothetical protein
MTNRLCCLVLSIVAVALPAFARKGVPGAFQNQSKPQSALEQTLISAEKNLMEAMERNDVAYARNAVSDDFYAIGTNGDSHSKGDLLEDMHEDGGKGKGKPILYFFQVIPLNDGAAVVTYDMVKPGERPRYQHISNTWVKQGDQWKLKFQQSTPNLWSANDL